MTSRNLEVLSISAGSEFGWVWLTVPRACIFGRQESEISSWDYDHWTTSEPATAIAAARKAREIQGLEYRCGPAIVTDSWRLHAMLELLQHQKLTGDSTVNYQSLDETANGKITDDSLHHLGMYLDDITLRTATRHALILLRRVKRDQAFAHELWPYPASGRP